jgi:hypothetical protein
MLNYQILITPKLRQCKLIYGLLSKYQEVSYVGLNKVMIRNINNSNNNNNNNNNDKYIILYLL